MKELANNFTIVDFYLLFNSKAVFKMLISRCSEHYYRGVHREHYRPKMSTPLSFQAVFILQFAISSLSQFLPPSMFQQQPSMQASMSPMGGPMMMPSPMQGFPLPYPQQRLPVMMMPFHSRAADKKYMARKKRKPKYYVDSDSSSDSESCSSNEYLRSQGRGKKKRQVLTPVISYVTRNGRVVYQKKIKKENAGDWLEIGGKKLMEEDKASGDMTIRDLKHKYGLKRHHHRNEE